MHPASQRFHDKLKELGELHDRKQADYGIESDPFYNVRSSSEFGVPGHIGAAIRMSDKMRRIQASARGSKLQNEGILDSFDDIAVYSIIGGLLWEDEQGLIVPKLPVGERIPRWPVKR